MILDENLFYNFLKKRSYRCFILNLDKLEVKRRRRRRRRIWTSLEYCYLIRIQYSNKMQIKVVKLLIYHAGG